MTLLVELKPSVLPLYVIGLLLVLAGNLGNMRTGCHMFRHHRLLHELLKENGRTEHLSPLWTSRRNHPMLTIGVIAIQGAVSEHVVALEKVSSGLNCKIETIKKKGIVPHCDGLVIPGGESTTISRLLRLEGINKEILKNQHIPMMGTCAGLIILSEYQDKDVEGLGLMDMQVKRNAFGRQAESFELPLEVTVFDSPFNAIFIRAPAIKQVGNGIDILARVKEYGVAAQQGNKLALSFHPELSDDLRFHKYFLQLLDSSS